MSEVHRVVSALRFADVLDVVVIATLLYLVARWFLHRASWAMALGVTLVLALYVTAQLLSMYLTLTVFRAGAVLIAIVLAIVFQADVRRGIERLAAWRPGRRGVFEPMEEIKGILVEAVAEIAERRLGAIVVLKGRQPLDAYVRGGVPLHGEPSFPLLVSLFDDRTPGHDGAVVLNGPIISRFGVHLPLSKNLAELGDYGTRHAAALGLSECCDALVIVVSEEQGTISIARGGELSRLASAAELGERVDSFYARQDQGPSGARVADRAADWGLKAASVLVACLLWGVFAYRVDVVEQTFDNVPVEFRNIPAGWQVEMLYPGTLQLRLSGPERAFDQLDPSDLRVSIDMNEYAPKRGIRSIPIEPDALNLPRGVSLAAGDPHEIELRMDEILTRAYTVQPELVGDPAAGYRVGHVRVVPEKLRLQVPSRRLGDPPQTVPTEPIELLGTKESFTRRIGVRLPPGAVLVGNRKNEVQVSVEIVPVEQNSDE